MNRNLRRLVWVALAIFAILPAMTFAPIEAQAADPAWRGEYYPNRWLAGAPLVVRDDPAINFDWGVGSPHPYLPADAFSARWTRTAYFEGGRYRFTVQADDGIRLFVDGALLIDKWEDQAGATHTVERDLAAGDHALRVEYYENTGGALARVSWARIDGPPPPAGGWRGEYWSNPWLSGSPVVVRDDPNVNFNWGFGSPDPALPPDRFSARWSRTAAFEGSRYRFTVVTDDGARLYVDGRLVLDAWKTQPATTYRIELDMPAGNHAIRLEYFEDAGEASARLIWERIGGTTPTGQWSGEYWSNRDLSGQPTLIRADDGIEFAWGLGAPDARLPADNFSVRWTRNVEFGGGRYRFTTVTDDGVRLYVDGRLIINQWRDMGRESHTAEVELRSGVHTLRMEYYEHTGAADARLTWAKAPPKRDIGNIVTCARPSNSWVRIYRQESGRWLDTNPRGYSPISASGYMKLDGMLVDTSIHGAQGHPYRVELWADGRLIRSVGNTTKGEPEFRVRAFADNYTPWGCPAP